MTQTWAIFFDAYRSLNAKKMFWVVLAISLLVVAAFALVGINERGLKIAFWQLDTKWMTSRDVSPALFYKGAFLTVGVGLWLTWVATILALISTAGIFPELITSGSIDLLVSKPISRLRLFLTQYAAGLLFVTLQVGIFSLASFLVIGLRGGVWEPGLFMAVPLVVCFFSYLFSVCVFFGIATRSTLAALLLTLLFWCGIGIVTIAENALLMARTLEEQGVSWDEMQQPRRHQAKPQPTPGAKSSSSLPAAGSSAQPPNDAHPQKDPAKVPRAMARSVLKAVAEPPQAGQKQTASSAGGSDPGGQEGGSRTTEFFYNLVYDIKTVLPKTGDTVDLLERTLVNMAELPDGAFGQPKKETRQGRVAQQMAETIRARSAWWIVGTSLLFEGFVLAWAALIFCRRDF